MVEGEPVPDDNLEDTLMADSTMVLELGRIKTPCPSCKRTTLFVASQGGLTCSYLECQQPIVEHYVRALEYELEAEKARVRVLRAQAELAAAQEELREAEEQL